MLPQQYCLRWKYHHSNLQTMFSQLLDRGCFCDVTLACDGQTLKAHRVVLSACSTYFDSILTNCNSEKDPIIILKDVKFMDIKYLVEFMYKGEINVDHSNLASLLKTAEELRIKGLAEVSWRDDENENLDNNDNNNNNVNDTIRASPTSQLLGSPQSTSATALTSLTANGNKRELYDDKENVYKSLPFLAPLSSPSRKKRGRPPLDESNHFTRTPKYTPLPSDNYYDNTGDDNKDGVYDLSVTAPSTSSTTNTTTSTQSVLNHMKNNDTSDTPGPVSLKLETPLQLSRYSSHNGSTSKKLKHHSLVALDEKSHDDENSFYLPLKQNDNDHMEFDEAFSDSIAHKIETKLERPDSAPPDEDDEMLGSSVEHLQSIFLTNEEREEWKDVIRMNDYLTKGRRPQFWEEPFTKRVLDAIKNKNLEMKKAAKLLGVSYGTLYGRYRETYGCLKHPYRGPAGSYMVSRMREMWPGTTDDQNELLNLVSRGRIPSLLQSDEMNGANLIDMISDEAMLEQIPSLAKYSRKMLSNLTDVNSLLKQASSKNPISSNNSNSSRSESPNAISSSSATILKPVSPNPNPSGLEVAK